jgi:allantoicase
VTLPGVDLAAARLGGRAVAANDEFFAPKENLLAEHPPVFDPDAYTDRGKLMDGWETRRRRTPGHDWCIIRLGVPGIIREALVDTAHFTGNYPEACSIEGCVAGSAEVPPDDSDWLALLERTPLESDTEHRFAVERGWRVTHVRLSIYPDGGVARLRLLGEPLPDLRGIVGADGAADLAATAAGGLALDCSDRFFSSPHNLLAPGAARNMGDGWETRRRRGPGHDWAVIALAAEALVERIELDTTHFKGNYPDRFSVDGRSGDGDWRALLPETPAQPDTARSLSIGDSAPVTQIRLNVYPDGGVARLRVHGRVTDDGWRGWGVRWLNALPPAEAAEALRSCCASSAWAEQLIVRRPFADFAELTDTADAVWAGLGPDDWLEAFAAHPRIGERSASTWSGQEQAGTAAADQATLDALVEGNEDYEERFGHVFLICATGKSAAQMLAALRGRLGNDPDTELRVAADEHRKITRIRLDKLVRPDQTATASLPERRTGG